MTTLQFLPMLSTYPKHSQDVMVSSVEPFSRSPFDKLRMTSGDFRITDADIRSPRGAVDLPGKIVYVNDRNVCSTRK